MEKLPASKMIEELIQAQELHLLEYVLVEPTSEQMPSSVWLKFAKHITPATRDLLIQFIQQKYAILYINGTSNKDLIYIHY